MNTSLKGSFLKPLAVATVLVLIAILVSCSAAKDSESIKEPKSKVFDIATANGIKIAGAKLIGEPLPYPSSDSIDEGWIAYFEIDDKPLDIFLSVVDFFEKNGAVPVPCYWNSYQEGKQIRDNHPEFDTTYERDMDREFGCRGITYGDGMDKDLDTISCKAQMNFPKNQFLVEVELERNRERKGLFIRGHAVEDRVAADIKNLDLFSDGPYVESVEGRSLVKFEGDETVDLKTEDNVLSNDITRYCEYGSDVLMYETDSASEKSVIGYMKEFAGFKSSRWITSPTSTSKVKISSIGPGLTEWTDLIRIRGQAYFDQDNYADIYVGPQKSIVVLWNCYHPD